MWPVLGSCGGSNSLPMSPHKSSYTFGLLSEFPAPGRVNDNVGKAKVEWEMSPGACEWPPLTWNRNCHGQNSERNSGKQILGHKLPLWAKFSVYNEEGWRIFAYPAFSACFRVSLFLSFSHGLWLLGWASVRSYLPQNACELQKLNVLYLGSRWCPIATHPATTFPVSCFAKVLITLVRAVRFCELIPGIKTVLGIIQRGLSWNVLNSVFENSLIFWNSKTLERC